MGGSLGLGLPIMWEQDVVLAALPSCLHVQEHGGVPLDWRERAWLCIAQAHHSAHGRSH
jgi:hypothetical protein